MFLVLLKTLIGSLFTSIVAAPSYFFRQVDQHVLGEEDQTTSVYYVDRQNIIQCDSIGLDTEQRRLDNINEMIRTATTGDQWRVWTRKRDEMLRTLRWRRLEEFAGGRSR